MQDFKDKVAVITGGASGLGREFAKIAAKLGMKLALADVQVDALALAQREFEAEGVEVIAVCCDVSKVEQVQALADAIMQQ